MNITMRLATILAMVFTLSACGGGDAMRADLGAGPVRSDTPASAAYSWGDYTLSKAVGATAVDVVNVSNGRTTKWSGNIGSTRPLPAAANGHALTFEFTAIDYFTPSNSGHFALAVGGDGDTSKLLRGRGLAIGSVQAYGKRTATCGPSSTPNRVVIETFWSAGNCVYGGSEGPVMVDGETYKVTTWVTTSSPPMTGYSLQHKRADGSWRDVVSASVVDTDNPDKVVAAGWWVIEVFSEHAWTVHLRNVVERVW